MYVSQFKIFCITLIEIILQITFQNVLKRAYVEIIFKDFHLAMLKTTQDNHIWIKFPCIKLKKIQVKT